MRNSPEFGSQNFETPPDIFAQWQRTAAEILEKDEEQPPRSLGPDRSFPLHIQGVDIPAFERVMSNGQKLFELQIILAGTQEQIASLRYRNFNDTIVMGKTEVDEKYQGLGINRALFAHMSELHPNCTTITTKLDGTNLFPYRRAIQEGADPYEAVLLTPAAKVRAAAGWTIDFNSSNIPEWSDEERRWKGPTKSPADTTTRLVYRRKPLEESSPNHLL